VNRPRAGALVVVALAVLAAALRFPALAARPMHADEAVHADKLGTLLEGGGYAYDPVEFHGPTLYYLTLVPLRLEGARRYVEVDEAALRAVPAAFGTLLVLAHLLARPTLGLGGALWAALFAAISPAMVYYSRYYIHEMLLVAWSFGALLAAAAWLRRPSARSAAAAGFCAGLMLATKETAVTSPIPTPVAAVGPGRSSLATSGSPPRCRLRWPRSSSPLYCSGPPACSTRCGPSSPTSSARASPPSTSTPGTTISLCWFIFRRRAHPSGRRR
jgi:4-amino-4-deoxy-L-arabinose transferase-like glycosyltransferase